MALVSGRGSRLNPNAAPFIPAVYRQVEDFSSEWWNLVQNSPWFRDYWMRENQEANFEDISDSKDEDITNLLPDTFDVGYDEFPYAEAEFEEFVGSFETHDGNSMRAQMKPQKGLGLDAAALAKSFDFGSLSPKGRGTSYLVEHAKYNERPVQRMSFNHGPRRIYQPR